MQMVRLITLVGLIVSVALATAPAHAREWLDATGKHKIIAELVAVRGDKAILEKPDGAIITIPLNKLSRADQEYIKSQTAKPAPSDSKSTAGETKTTPPDTKMSSPTGGAKPATTDGLALAERVESILRTGCYRCHGEDGASEGGFNFVVNLDKLASTMAKPGQAAQSLLLQRMKATDEGVMPPVGEDPRPSAEDLATIEAWIQAGSPVKPKQEVRPFITHEQIVEAIYNDVSKQGERSRRFMRYFTLTHLYNAGVSEDELQTYRNAFSKLINSLSWNTSMVIPRPIDSARTVMVSTFETFTGTGRCGKPLRRRTLTF